MSPEALQEAISSLRMRVLGATSSLDIARQNAADAHELEAKSEQLVQEAEGRLEMAQEALDGLLAMQEPETGAESVPEADSPSTPDEVEA